MKNLSNPNNNQSISIKGEWFLQYDNGPILGPFNNSMTTAGLEKFAAKIATLESPFIAIGNVGGEAFRKAVGAVIQTGASLRFRSFLALSEANGDHTWLALYSDATVNPESGIKINHLDLLFSKSANQVLNIECKITVQQGAAGGA